MYKFLFTYISQYSSCTENIPVRVKIVSGFILQRGVKVEAAFVDEKLDELSKKKKRKRKI